MPPKNKGLTKQKIIHTAAKDLKISRPKVAKIVNHLFDLIEKSLTNGEAVYFVHLFSFDVLEQERKVRREGLLYKDEVVEPPKFKIIPKISKHLQAKLNKICEEKYKSEYEFYRQEVERCTRTQEEKLAWRRLKYQVYKKNRERLRNERRNRAKSYREAKKALQDSES